MPTSRITPHLRVLAIDDAPFARKPHARVPLVGVLTRGARHVEAIYSTTVRRDGWRATDAITSLVREHDIARQARCILLDGIAVGGFNVIDVSRLAATLDTPVIAVMRKEPDLVAMRNAMARVSRPEARWRLVEAAGTIHRARHGFFQCAGCEPSWARDLVAMTTVDGHYPEPLRLAHLIGAGVVLGRSRSRA
jgi:hypothetical protein